MVAQIILLDIAPDPVSTGDSVAGIVLIGIVVLLVVSAALTGFVFLLKRFTRASGVGTRVVVGDACLNLDRFGSRSNRVTSPPIIGRDLVSNSLRSSAKPSDLPLRLIKRT